MDQSIKDKYQLVVGLEVHAQLLTDSKAYSSESTEFGNLPNTNISVLTLAHPGTLPKVNKKVVELHQNSWFQKQSLSRLLKQQSGAPFHVQ